MFVSDVERGTVRPYIEDVAVQAEATRLSIFTDLASDAALTKAEGILQAIALALPHTPVGAIGINFTLVEQDIPEGLADMVSPRDRLEKVGIVLATEVTSALQESADCTLNFQRGIHSGSFVMNFNYHINVSRMSEIDDRFKGILAKNLERSKEIAKTLYDLESAELNFLTALNR